MADEPDEGDVDSGEGTTRAASADAAESAERSDTGSPEAEEGTTSATGGLDVTIPSDSEDAGEDGPRDEADEVDPVDEADEDDPVGEEAEAREEAKNTEAEAEGEQDGSSPESDDGSTEETEDEADADADSEPVEERERAGEEGPAETVTDEESEGDREAESDDGRGDLEEAEGARDAEEPEEPEGVEETDGADEAGEADKAEEADEPVTREAKTDGEGVVEDVPERERSEPSYPDPDDDVGGLDAPPDDEEMPLADHIEEMILRLAVVFLFGGIGTAIGLFWASDAIGYIWLEVFPVAAEEVPPAHVYHPLELWLTRIKVSALLGIMLALPMFVYQCYRFMRPGLYPHERKYYLASVPTSVVLAGIGMLFSFFVVLPVLFQYFTFYAEGSADIAYALGETFNLIITLTGFLAIVFQIPLFIMLAIMMGVTTRRWLAEKRLYFWAAFFGLSFMFTIDPTMMAPIIVALVMILLFEGTLLILKWVGRE